MGVDMASKCTLHIKNLQLDHFPTDYNGEFENEPKGRAHDQNSATRCEINY